MTTPNTTNIPAPRVPFVDERTGLISREWFRFLNNQFQLTGGGTTAISLADLELAPYSDAATEAELTVTQSRVEALELAPRPPELTPVSFGSFFSTQTQVATVINTATAISYNNAAINGTAVANSGSVIRIQGNNAEIFSAANFFLPLSNGDYFQLYFSVDDLSVRLEQFAASAPVPAIPSIILTVMQVYI